METVGSLERKKWIDNLRWVVILIVVVFHVFFYYNNINGVEAIFKVLPDNPSQEGGKVAYTFAGVFQYAVYQWFMVLLFVISGICARYTLQKKTTKQFMRSRLQKLLVPSTLGVVCVHWIGGFLLTKLFMSGEEAEKIPGVIKFIISIFSGIGGLWFCHILVCVCLVLVLIKKIDKNGKLEKAAEKSNLLVAVLAYFLMLGAAQILNIPKITTYRMAYYPLSFLLGYYVFSSEKLLAQLKKFGWIFLLAGIIVGILQIRKFYGTYYADYVVLNNWLSILFAWLVVLGIIGVAQNIMNFENSFSRYMSKAGWGIYINHITLMIIINYVLYPVAAKIPVALLYSVVFVLALTLSIGFWELFRRIPVLRYVLYGIKGQKKDNRE